ncbi:RNA helicase [Rasamsonia emersonii CBS 393.64]|uniref:RNA helicase n=1 Tax=Rasamsonia emersonii (strain ATCC 16479 / CBS 393.64 / IMI 116815) TaxID=1408163 RepID=A0A0F4YUK7_RASE3|nr:RNA helicase [Rasamsonia emersonii CBS 393.64]KKA21541.1 RNA helicase [Rasamsonia emersonii CBS 393.64]
MGTKRERDHQGATGKSKKRQKVEKPANGADADTDRLLGVDELDWKEVQLPDRLDDAGGFFGLEEIEGVDIVRPQGGGEVKFKSILKKPAVEKEETSYDDEEWTGFSDEEPATESQPTETSQKDQKDVAKESKDKKSEKPLKKKNAAEKPQNQGIQSGLSFEALQYEEEDGVDVSAWDSLGLSPSIQTGLSKLKFSSPTPVQKACIPEILAGHDVIGKAATGSGKTLAFGIPILEQYLDRSREKHADMDKKESEPIALILSPTRELAHQLAKHIGALNTHTPDANAKIALLTGGLSIQKQQRLLADADIVIGTPGRVWEILSTGHGLIRKMKQIRFLVVDEADRLLSEGHFKEVEEILNALDRTEDNGFPDESQSEDDDNSQNQRQTLVFSATFHRGLQQKLAGKGRFVNNDLMNKKESMEYLLEKLNFREERPKFIDINPVSQMAEGLKEGIVQCAAMEKDLYLYTLLLYHPGHRTLVFTNSISAVRRLVQFLQTLRIPAIALHSNMEQKARLRSVEKFSSPSSDPSSVLVATDVAARGLDIKGIDFVIHYHVPRTADMYVHRSGRTARAGAQGKSILICAPEEVVGVARLVAKVHAEANTNKATKRNPLESVELDSRIVSRVRPRVNLAKRITESTMAKEKLSAEENWLRNAAEELGVEYDSEEFEQQARQAKGKGRGLGRHQREKQASSVTKEQLAAMRAELKQMLSKRINVGVSERYITAGRVDIEALLRGEGNNKTFIGQVDELDF